MTFEEWKRFAETYLPDMLLVDPSLTFLEKDTTWSVDVTWRDNLELTYTSSFQNEQSIATFFSEKGIKSLFSLSAVQFDLPVKLIFFQHQGLTAFFKLEYCYDFINLSMRSIRSISSISADDICDVLVDLAMDLLRYEIDQHNRYRLKAVVGEEVVQYGVYMRKIMPAFSY